MRKKRRSRWWDFPRFPSTQRICEKEVHRLLLESDSHCRKWSNNFPSRTMPDARWPLQTLGNLDLHAANEPKHERDKCNPWIGSKAWMAEKTNKTQPETFQNKKIFAFYGCFWKILLRRRFQSFPRFFVLPRASSIPHSKSFPTWANLRINVNAVITEREVDKGTFLVPHHARLRGITCQSVPSVMPGCCGTFKWVQTWKKCQPTNEKFSQGVAGANKLLICLMSCNMKVVGKFEWE